MCVRVAIYDVVKGLQQVVDEVRDSKIQKWPHGYESVQCFGGEANMWKYNYIVLG